MAIAHVQNKSAVNDGSTSSVAVTLDSTPVEDNLLVIVGGTGAGAADLPTGWTLALEAEADGETRFVYYKYAGASESTSVSVSGSAVEEYAMTVYEFSGIVASSPLDKTNSASSGASTVSSHQPGTTGTLSQAVEVALSGCFIWNGVNQDGSVDSSFTEVADLFNSSGSMNWFSGYKIVSATTALNPQWSWTTASEARSEIATFKGAATINELAATPSGTATASGTIFPELEGELDGSSAVSGSLTNDPAGNVELEGDLDGVATFAGTLSVYKELSGTLAGVSVVTGQVQVEGEFAANVDGYSSVSASLTNADPAELGKIVELVGPLGEYTATYPVVYPYGMTSGSVITAVLNTGFNELTAEIEGRTDVTSTLTNFNRFNEAQAIVSGGGPNTVLATLTVGAADTTRAQISLADPAETPGDQSQAHYVNVRSRATTGTASLTVSLEENQTPASPPSYVASGAKGESTGDATYGLPAGWAEDDLFMLCVEMENGTGLEADPFNPTGAPAAPTGYTLYWSQASQAAGFSDRTRMAVYWKRATASESSVFFSDVGNHQVGFISAWRGVDWAYGPFDDAASGSTSTNDTSVTTSPGITTVTDKATILWFSSAGDALTEDATFSSIGGGTGADTGPTLAKQATTLGGTDGSIMLAYGSKNSGGSVGGMTATVYEAEEEANLTVALIPIGGGGPVVLQSWDVDMSASWTPYSLLVDSAVSTAIVDYNELAIGFRGFRTTASAQVEVSWAQLSIPPPAGGSVSTEPYQYSTVGWGTEDFAILGLSPGVTYDLGVRAVDTSGNMSPWATLTHTAAADTIPPSDPAPPQVAANTLAIQITHTLGVATGGTYNLEADIDHLNVYMGTTAGFPVGAAYKVGELPVTASHLALQIPAVGTFPVPPDGNPPDTTRYVRVTAVDRTGNESGPSAAVSSQADLIANIHITDATITSAKISDLSATKITTGTLTGQTITLAPSVTDPAILKSTNYVADSSGFYMDSTGYAEFNDVVVRGSLSGATVYDFLDIEAIVRISGPGGDDIIIDPTFSPWIVWVDPGTTLGSTTAYSYIGGSASGPISIHSIESGFSKGSTTFGLGYLPGRGATVIDPGSSGVSLELNGGGLIEVGSMQFGGNLQNLWSIDTSGLDFNLYNGGVRRLRVRDADPNNLLELIGTNGVSIRHRFTNDAYLSPGEIFIDGYIQTGDGSAPNPAWGFGNEGGTGIYRSSTSTLALAAGGAPRAIVNNTGIYAYTGVLSLGTSSSDSFRHNSPSSNMVAWFDSSAYEVSLQASNFLGTGATIGFSSMDSASSGGNGARIIQRTAGFTRYEIYLDTSSREHKRDISYLDTIDIDAGGLVDQLRPAAFRDRFDDEAPYTWGLIAEDVYEVVPTLATIGETTASQRARKAAALEGEDPPSPEYGPTGYEEKGIVGLLVQAVKDLRREVRELKRDSGERPE